MASPPSVRPEYVRDQVDEQQFGVVNKPLTPWERVYGNALVRKTAILLILAAAWQAYAMHLDNSLVLPTFIDTVKAFVELRPTSTVPASQLVGVSVAAT